MDLTTEWLQSTKFAEIDRIVSKLPQEGKETFHQEWQLVYPEVRKKIWNGRIKLLLGVIVAYPVLLFLLNVLRTYIHKIHLNDIGRKKRPKGR
ncbi:hypothetical protein [Streptococcus dentiloxodontae]